MLSRTFGANQEVIERWLPLSVAETREKLGA
jgi:hypothetical protein